MSYLAALHTYETIGVVGLGQSGLSCVRFLLQQGITPRVFDTREAPPQAEQLKHLDATLTLTTGPLDIAELLTCDVLIVGPGLDLRLPALQMAADAGIPLVGDADVFAQFAQAPVLGITGSNGKSTVTQLTGELLSAAGLNVAVGGNIGVPMLDVLADDVDVYVLELSSFQLDLMHDLHLHAATLLNISDDHLDRYNGADAYAVSKHRIYQQVDYAIWNRDQRSTAPLHVPVAKQLSFGTDAAATTPGQFGISAFPDPQICHGAKPIVAVDDLPLAGLHNVLNVQAALALVSTLNVTLNDLVPALKSFHGLPHRCELVAEQGGVRWVNDSKATNIGAAEAAIYGLRPLVEGKLILIAGGDGKGADFATFRDALAQVDALIVLGRDGNRIAAFHPHAQRAVDLNEAVRLAAAETVPGSTVLLAPACASLDMFNSYQHRGDVFKAAVVEQLAEVMHD
ncbi:UDP-N-acetylmuramoyl-L-alanine--D-glutamate ligase [Pseudidiomarina sediminum]|uniref:UDP-N-acetylmuramoyl-L-alanine--D-glutamate ligase n=1 Tax=Pseudidiomarina sediminum TaxID=431675 RepID=UPI001C96B280|nr:UDP-N-acetylmuramoyl-L-alanine--D-glutamate ligase [Pseudidiomarina sediminum]